MAKPPMVKIIGLSIENLSQEELEQLLARGRIRDANRKKRPNPGRRSRVVEKRPASESTRNSGKIASENSEPDPEWLKAEIEKTKKNIARPERDDAQSEQRHEAAKF